MTALSVIARPQGRVGVPVLEQVAGTPRWVSRRGGDVRAYDVSAAQEVYGPSHAFAASTDIVVTNGILRYHVGARLAAPALAVAVFAGGAWRAKGTLRLDTGANVLAGARLVEVTPDAAVVVLSLLNRGDIAVRLHRGEQMLRILHGLPRVTTSASRYVAWVGANGSPLTTGRMYEATVDGGTTRVADAQGLTRGLAVLRSGAVKSSGLALSVMSRSVLVGAFVATTNAGDDVADHHRQVAAQSDQHIRVQP